LKTSYGGLAENVRITVIWGEGSKIAKKRYMIFERSLMYLNL